MIKNNITIKILVDNNVKDGLIKEHGFSIWIEAFGKRILFDTGQGKALIPNACALRCDLSSADMLILSHGHYDHSGSISDVLKCNSRIHVYCHPEALVPRYSIPSQSAPKVISIQPKESEALLNIPVDRMHWVTAPAQIESNIGLTGSIPRLHPLEDVGGPFYLDSDGHYPDPIKDDIALWINTERGLVIITGCCHSGLINTVNYVRRVSGQEKISAIIGGFHLAQASQQRLESTSQALLEWNVDTIIPCHCTGDKATAFLQNQLGKKVISGYAGLKWKIIIADKC